MYIYIYIYICCRPPHVPGAHVVAARRGKPHMGIELQFQYVF